MTDHDVGAGARRRRQRDGTADQGGVLSQPDQTLSDGDQTDADMDQTAADGDQAVADAEQRAADRDQDAADRDQATADRRTADQSIDAGVYESTRAARAGSTAERDATAATRISAGLARAHQAAQRDEAARRRDQTALARDRATELRDRALEQTVAQLASDGPASGPLATLRVTATAVRRRAAADRARAADDRIRAAEDRGRAAADRREARVELESAYRDDLTGAYTRGFGLLRMEHEIERAHRSREPLVLAFVDVDGLKRINDAHGHAAGDAVLRAVGTELRTGMRSYDPVVRVGGDEFVAAFTNTAASAASRRLAMIQARVGQAGVGGSITVGLAELEPGDDLALLTARGDAELYRARRPG